MIEIHNVLQPQKPVILTDEQHNMSAIRENGGIVTSSEPRTTRMIITPFYAPVDEVQLAVAGTKESWTITVDDATNIVDGSHLILTDTVTNAFHICDAIGAPSGNIVTIDTPLGQDFGIGTFVTVGDHDLTVPAGTLANPVKYQVRTSLATQVEVAYDVARMMVAMVTTGVGDLENFGDGAALVNGIVIRKRLADGTYQNLHNVKTNGELKQLMYDFEILSATNPQQGANGISGRFSFSKLGGYIRLGLGENFEMLVQDDLSTRVLKFGVLTEGQLAE